MIKRMANFFRIWENLCLDKNTDWEDILGEKVFELMKPKWTEWKTKPDEWMMDSNWQETFNMWYIYHIMPEDTRKAFEQTVQKVEK